MRNLYSHYILIFVSLLIFLNLSVATCFAEAPIILSAPPRETPEKGQETYGPIAELLSKELGRKVIYKHPGNWFSYSANIRKDLYDLIFDGPHFVSWRIEKHNHTPLVKIPGEFYFIFIARKDNKTINNVSDLIGKKVCGHAPPNQGTLRLFNQFNNPLRLPILVQIKGWRNIFDATMEGKCTAGIVPYKIFRKVDPNRARSKVIFESKHVSGQAITAGKRLTLGEVEKARQALLSLNGLNATGKLRKRFASAPLITATREEYKNVYKLLQDSYGFDVVNQ